MAAQARAVVPRIRRLYTRRRQLSLRMGSRTLMMSEGKILLDLCREQRERMSVPELLERFQQAGSCALDNDRILLSKVEK